MKQGLNATIYSATLFVCFIIVVFIYRDRQQSLNTINLIGMGTKDFTSDLIVWRGSFSRMDMDLKTAYSMLDGDREMTRKYLLDKGLDEKEMVFSAVEISKEMDYHYDKDNNYVAEFSGYKLTQYIKIESEKVEETEAVSRQVSELLNMGVEFYSEMPEYYYTKLSELKMEMIALATEDARNRAEIIAKNSGSKLDKLKSATLDVFQITGRNSVEAFSWGGTFNTSSKEKTATITLTIKYQVD